MSCMSHSCGMTKVRTSKAERGGESLTTKPLTVPAANGADDSDWRRLPRPKDRLAGLSRTTWNELLDSGQIKGVTIRKKGAIRGIKLVFWPSAMSYLSHLMEQGSDAEWQDHQHPDSGKWHFVKPSDGDIAHPYSNTFMIGYIARQRAALDAYRSE